MYRTPDEFHSFFFFFNCLSLVSSSFHVRGNKKQSLDISLYQIDGLIVPLVEPTVSLKIFISILLSFLIFFVFSWNESHLTTFQGKKKCNLQFRKSEKPSLTDVQTFFYLPHLSQSCVYMFLVSVLLINYISCTYSPALLLVCKSETWKMV